MADRLVSCDWLAEHMMDDDVRVAEVDVDVDAYAEGHIPGAVGWNWTTQLQDATERDILTRASFEELLGASGIGNESHVVLYGDNNNWFAAYAVWLLELYGHERISLLDGGRAKWLTERCATTTDAATPTAVSYSAQDLDLSQRAYRDDVLAAVAAGTQMIDVRSAAEFVGDVIAPPGMSETAQRAGHIPGASNIPWAQVVNEDGTFRSADELRQIYGAAGITDGDPTIVYCRIGERSSHSWFVLRHILGYADVKNYDGSWTEYGSLIGAPIEK